MYPDLHEQVGGVPIVYLLLSHKMQLVADV